MLGAGPHTAAVAVEGRTAAAGEAGHTVVAVAAGEVARIVAAAEGVRMKGSRQLAAGLEWERPGAEGDSSCPGCWPEELGTRTVSA
jgi:hypothetical protein